MDNKVIGFVEEWEAFGFAPEEEFDNHIDLTKEEREYLLTLPAAKRTRGDLTYGKDYVYDVPLLFGYGLDGKEYFKVYCDESGMTSYEKCFKPAEGTGTAMLKEGECVYTTPSEDSYKELQRINDELEKDIISRTVKKLKDSDT